MKRNFHFFVLIAVFGLAVGAALFLVTSGTSSAVHSPSELYALGSKDVYRVRVAGMVSSQTFSYETEPQFKLEFFLVDRPKNDSADEDSVGVTDEATAVGVPVVYEDIKPDMFTNGRDVLIDGNYVNGVLQASTLLTQCPSKYEPEEGPTAG